MADTEEILKMWDGGMSAAAIAAELDTSEGSVRKVLLAHGRSKKSREREDEAAIVKEYQDPSVPVTQILTDHQLTYPQLYTVLARNTVPLRRQTESAGKALQLDAAVALYEDGAMLWKIKEITGVSQPQLHAELHKRNVPLRRPRRST